MGVGEKCHLFYKHLYSTLTNIHQPAVCRMENVDCKRWPIGVGRSNVKMWTVKGGPLVLVGLMLKCGL